MDKSELSDSERFSELVKGGMSERDAQDVVWPEGDVVPDLNDPNCECPYPCPSHPDLH